MAQVGRPPKPVEQKRRLGNPGQRPLPQIASVTALDTADRSIPVHLTAAGAQVWEHVVAWCPWFAQSDRHALVELCDLVDLRAMLVAQIRGDGVLTPTGSGSMQAHPNWVQVIALTKQIHGLMSLFGLTPSDRGRIGLGEVQAKSKLQALIEAERKS
jgi:P27 family predicted phage terminase small subunit